MEAKRVFFAMDVVTTWPDSFPNGRIIEPQNRHLTLCFLGAVDIEKLVALLPLLPLPNFKVGIVGEFDQPLFLPPRTPHVAAWHIHWLEEASPLLLFVENLSNWLEKNGFQPDRRHPFTPHVTMARSPFSQLKWQKSFEPRAMMVTTLHLFESLGHSHYRSLWHHPLLLPFEEIEHTADLAYRVFGHTLQQLYDHAKVALAFTFPKILPSISPTPSRTFYEIEDVIIALGEIVTHVDQEIGSPFKAVSFHNKVKVSDILEWEMIVDV